MKSRTEHVETARQFRTDALALLHRLKATRKELHTSPSGAHELPADDIEDVQRQHDLAIEALETCILRQSLVLRSIDAFEEPADALPVVRTEEADQTLPPAGGSLDEQ